MKKMSIFLFAALAFALLANRTGVQASPASDAEVHLVGLVVEYTESQSISIVNKDGNQYDFELAALLKIVPVHRANMLGPGAYVTVIAPNNVSNGKQIATGIVIHPKVPSGFPMPAATLTPAPTDATMVPTETGLPTEPPTGEPTETMTPTETPTEVEPPTETATPTPTEETSSETELSQVDVQMAVISLVDWLASFLRQILAVTG